MAIFGKGRKDGSPPSGLGRGLLNGDAPAGDVIDVAAVDLAKQSGEPADEPVVADVAKAKPSRFGRKPGALSGRLKLKGGKAETGVEGAPVIKKSRKALKAEKEALDAEKTNVRLSNMVMIDFYPGMAKEDAIETARHWAMTHMNMPSLCFYYVMKIRDGYAVEVQEGVGRAYLPSVVELAQANPGRLIVVPMIRRKMTVFYSARLGEFEAQILPELQEPPAMPENPPIQAVRSVAMTPIMKQYREWLISGAVAAGIGGLALLSSLTFYAFDPKAKVPPEWRTTDVALLPVMQWGRLQADATDSYVTRLEFQDGNWRVVRQAVGATVDVATPGSTDSGGAIVGGTVPTPNGNPGGLGIAPGQSPAPGAAPSSAPQVPPPSSAAPAGTAPNTIPPPAGGPNS